MLAPALGRHRRHRAFNQLEQGLLHALARHVTRDGRVIRLARNFVNLVDVNDALLRAFNFVVAALQKLLNNVLNVLAHITCLGQCGRVGHDERHVQRARQGLRQQCFA